MPKWTPLRLKTYLHQQHLLILLKVVYCQSRHNYELLSIVNSIKFLFTFQVKAVVGHSDMHTNDNNKK